MTIETDVEASIQKHMEAGASPDTRTGSDLIAALQACPYPEVDLEPIRVPSPVLRDISV
ncbi:MAG: hypothetical protein NTV52_11080 [Acidobacteria bacterium]|nr:hypothetical protein [Acidobacteriota bacterium]